MNDFKLRKPGKKVFERPKPKLTLVPPATDAREDSVVQVELSPEVKEMLREMQQQQRRRARRDGSDMPDAA